MKLHDMVASDLDVRFQVTHQGVCFTGLSLAVKLDGHGCRKSGSDLHCMHVKSSQVGALFPKYTQIDSQQNIAPLWLGLSKKAAKQ